MPLHWLPAGLHRFLYRMAHRARLVVWRLAGKRGHGVRVIAMDEAGRVLLVRHSYGSPLWMPPGGGLSRGEDALTAARRELAEETGCLPGKAVLLEMEGENPHAAPYPVTLVACEAWGLPRADGREILEAAFFALDALPDGLSGETSRCLIGWAEQGRRALEQ